MPKGPGTTGAQIVEAGRARLLADGYAALSTRRVADAAGVPLSQIHYHFGGKRGLLLAVLDAENRRLVERQRRMYGTDTPLWQRYEQACDLLADDLADEDRGAALEVVAVVDEVVAVADEARDGVLRSRQLWLERARLVVAHVLAKAVRVDGQERRGSLSEELHGARA